jgi:Histone methylation protein DOT1
MPPARRRPRLQMQRRRKQQTSLSRLQSNVTELLVVATTTPKKRPHGALDNNKDDYDDASNDATFLSMDHPSANAVTPEEPKTKYGRRDTHANQQEREDHETSHPLVDEVRQSPALFSLSQSSVSTETDQSEMPTKRRLFFGKLVNETAISDNVKTVYRIVKKLTGSIGGNASMGPIYGELTMGSMQKMINLMKLHTGLDHNSYFIDVGSGIGKPNLHVAQDPGVRASYGIEVEHSRWLLGMSCLRGVLDLASSQTAHMGNVDDNDDDNIGGTTLVGHRCIFDNKDILHAKSFNPFTHVYMFSIG